MHLLAKLLDHEGLPHGFGISGMLLDPSLQEVNLPSLHFARSVNIVCVFCREGRSHKVQEEKQPQ